MKTNQLKQVLNNVEICGLTSMFNIFYNDYLNNSIKQEYEFFYCSESLCSTDAANGQHLIFENLKVEYLGMLENGLTYIICQDNNEQEFIFEFNHYNNVFYDVTEYLK